MLILNERNIFARTLTFYSSFKLAQDLKWLFFWNLKFLNTRRAGIDIKKKPTALFDKYSAGLDHTHLKHILQHRFLYQKFYDFFKYKAFGKKNKQKLNANTWIFFSKISLYTALKRNWNFLIGKFISLLSWSHANVLESVDVKSLETLNKSLSKRARNAINIFKEKTFKKLKMLFLKNYDYFIIWKLPYSKMHYRLKTLTLQTKNKSHFSLATKPYLFLNTSHRVLMASSSFFINYWFIANYKFYYDIAVLSWKKKQHSLWHHWEMFDESLDFNFKKTELKLYCYFTKPQLLSKTIARVFTNTTPAFKLFIFAQDYFEQSQNFRKCLQDITEHTNTQIAQGDDVLVFEQNLQNVHYCQQHVKMFKKFENRKYVNERLHLSTQKINKHNMFLKKKIFVKNLMKKLKSLTLHIFAVEIEKRVNSGLHDYELLLLDKIVTTVDISKFGALIVLRKWISLYVRKHSLLKLTAPCQNVWDDAKTYDNFFIKTARMRFDSIKKTANHSLVLPHKHVLRPYSYFCKIALKSTNYSVFLPNVLNSLNRRFVKLTNSLTFSKLKPLVYYSYFETNFLLVTDGFCYLTHAVIDTSPEYFSEFKKDMFSFATRYEMHRRVLKLSLKNKIFHFFTSWNENAVESIVQRNTQNFSYLLHNDRQHKITNNLFALKPCRTATTPFSSWNDVNFPSSNFSIKRIKFKPGYRRIWKEARAVAQISFNMQCRYEYKFTRYLLRFNKYLRLKRLISEEMTVFNILKRVNFVFYNHHIEDLLNKQFVFVNNQNCVFKSFQIYANDFIQLIVNLLYYISYKYILNYFLKRKIKLKIRLKKKTTNFEISLNKKKSSTFPHWLLFENNIENDTPKFLELDFFSLSLFVLYEPFLLPEFANFHNHNMRYGITNMYNWKYIT